jgi:hypothetical protein
MTTIKKEADFPLATSIVVKLLAGMTNEDEKQSFNSCERVTSLLVQRSSQETSFLADGLYSPKVHTCHLRRTRASLRALWMRTQEG